MRRQNKTIQMQNLGLRTQNARRRRLWVGAAAFLFPKNSLRDFFGSPVLFPKNSLRDFFGHPIFIPKNSLRDFFGNPIFIPKNSLRDFFGSPVLFPKNSLRDFFGNPITPSVAFGDSFSRGRDRARSGNGTLHVPFPSSKAVKAPPGLCQESTCSPPQEEPRKLSLPSRRF